MIRHVPTLDVFFFNENDCADDGTKQTLNLHQSHGRNETFAPLASKGKEAQLSSGMKQHRAEKMRMSQLPFMSLSCPKGMQQ